MNTFRFCFSFIGVVERVGEAEGRRTSTFSGACVRRNGTAFTFCFAGTRYASGTAVRDAVIVRNLGIVRLPIYIYLEGANLLPFPLLQTEIQCVLLTKPPASAVFTKVRRSRSFFATWSECRLRLGAWLAGALSLAPQIR